MDRPKPLYTTENIEDEWKKLTEALNTNNFNIHRQNEPKWRKEYGCNHQP